VGPPFFNKATGPVALLLVAIMAVGPLLRWRRDRAQAAMSRVTWPLAAALLTAALLVAGSGMGVLPLLGLAFAVGLAAASVAPLWGRDLRRTPLFTWGMVVSHLGIAVSLAGMACDAAFTAERLVSAGVGEPVRVGPYTVTLKGITPVLGENWSALQGRLEVVRGGAHTILGPQQRFFSDPPTTTSESAILTTWDGQLYTVLGQAGEGGRWQLRLWWKPFVTLIWFGGGLVALGGVLSLYGRWRRERRSTREAWA
jgi:cytochrome c-type biogenesis protein CcmF